MPPAKVVVPSVPPLLQPALQRLRDTLGVPDQFPPEVVAAAEEAARAPQPAERADRTDIELVTIDPEGSMDLDQAVHVAKNGDGYTVHYAIADVAAWVEPGGPVDLEAHRRGQTLYAPDHRAPLHPPALSEAAASLLADGHARPALLWTVELDAEGEKTSATVERSLVTSRARLSYTEVQNQLDAGEATDSLHLLEIVGRLRQDIEAKRGGVSLQTPEQEITTQGDDWQLVYRAPLPVEGWNAQISLLVGAAAADIMIAGKVGILRTLPPAEQWGIDKLRHTAKGLHIDWPGDLSYPDFVRSLDPHKPTHLAMLNACTVLFRGAGYTAFDGSLPDGNLVHGALAMHYAHATAPLRRLVDRYVGETCVALCAGMPVPDWVRTQLPLLPPLMAQSDARAKKYERGIIDLLEALVLSSRVGTVFTGTVVEIDKDGVDGLVVIEDPAVEARVTGATRLGEETHVRLVSADVTTGKVAFELA
ncbi:MAG TPA: RNB domain-containing ribonuclease [Propionibacteriaceae bacterium]|nr:RNB domain-containing ribonuclease [Propionibacteriaceae bacterium]